MSRDHDCHQHRETMNSSSSMAQERQQRPSTGFGLCPDIPRCGDESVESEWQKKSYPPPKKKKIYVTLGMAL